MGITKAPIEVDIKATSHRTARFTECGHIGPLDFELKIFGEDYAYKLGEEHVKKVNGEDSVEESCPDCCLVEPPKKHAVRCCLCGLVILPGDGVALYHKGSAGIKKEFAEFFEGSAVGCLRFNCCPLGGFFSGHWTTEGFKSAFGKKS